MHKLQKRAIISDVVAFIILLSLGVGFHLGYESGKKQTVYVTANNQCVERD